MRGKCLCGIIEFEIDRDNLKLYQCHCRLCRQQSGTYSNAATIVPNESFRFLTGENKISSWVKGSGFRSDFCSRCGSPIPNPLRKTAYYWIPAGLLEEEENLEVVSHIFLGSKAKWKNEHSKVEKHLEFPGGIEQHISTLNR